jgi:hypothetical protein
MRMKFDIKIKLNQMIRKNQSKKIKNKININ